ncbi:MAG: hypothetical protein BAJALOKI1v1_680016 [Promethearchaeota archaeon]|nr:MAG: hypothetical protein BAJALOKI1v1_680016 [Candidatus Lokiarchaeota archaeon]
MFQVHQIKAKYTPLLREVMGASHAHVLSISIAEQNANIFNKLNDHYYKSGNSMLFNPF